MFFPDMNHIRGDRTARHYHKNH
ncbi:hypothetical protein A2U01_0073665, partial [Trifolium medium]|nr:hypothetical protein [Trifolium medium]